MFDDEFSGYQDWLNAFSEWTDVSISELHGLMTALVCVVEPLKQDEWVRLLDELSFTIPEENALRLLTEYGEDVHFSLIDKEDAYEFYPLVPDDNHDILEQFLALKDWVNGFLTGIGVADVSLSVDDKRTLEALSLITRFATELSYALSDDEESLELQEEDLSDDDIPQEYKDDDELLESQLEEKYVDYFEFARFVPVYFAVRPKKDFKDLALIKGLSQNRRTANEYNKLPPIIDASKKH